MEGYDLVMINSFYAQPQFNKKVGKYTGPESRIAVSNDLCVLMTSFPSQYGTLNPATGEYGLSAAWQSGLSNAVQVGSIIGVGLAAPRGLGFDHVQNEQSLSTSHPSCLPTQLMANGWLTDKFGYRKTMMGALVLMCAFIFITFFAHNIGMLLAGELLCGMPWVSVRCRTWWSRLKGTQLTSCLFRWY